MGTAVTWNGTSYTIPASGEVNWSALSTFLVDLGQHAAVAEEMKQAIRVATTSPVTVSATTDFCVVTNLGTPGAVAVNLPAGVAGQIFSIVDGKGDAGTNNITITPNGAETIAGAATLVLNTANEAVMIQYVSGDWMIIARKGLTNPMTTAGDIIYGGSSGLPTRLAGSAGFLKSTGAAAPAWSGITSANVTGTATNDSAAAGYIGEYKEVANTASDTNFPTSGQYGGDHTIQLTAGDWDLSLVVYVTAAGSISSLPDCNIGTATGNDSTGRALGSNYAKVSDSTQATWTMCIPSWRQSISGTTNYYVKIRATYTGGPPTYRYRLSARRVR